MVDRIKTKESEEGQEPRQRDYTNESSMRVVNFLLDPSEEGLKSVSRINRREALLLSIQIAKEVTLSLGKNSGAILATAVWRKNYLSLLRSVDGKTLGMGFGLAGGQIADESDAAAQEDEWT